MPVLQERFHYSSTDIVMHNFFLACVDVMTSIILTYLSSQLHPLKISKIRTGIALLLMILLPFLMTFVTSPVTLFLMQSLMLMFALSQIPSVPVFFTHFPVYCRFRCATLLFAFAGAITWVITSFGMIYLTRWLGSFGIWLLAMPIAIGSLYGLKHFERRERQFGLYPNLSRKGK
jgi:hypothetical protein